MHTRLVTFLLLATVLDFSSRAFCAEQTNSGERLTVHGRLTYSNGNPSCRIWIVGTRRLLGVRESNDEVAYMPKELRDLMSWNREILQTLLWSRSRHTSEESCRWFEWSLHPRLLWLRRTKLF